MECDEVEMTEEINAARIEPERTFRLFDDPTGRFKELLVFLLSHPSFASAIHVPSP